VGVVDSAMLDAEDMNNKSSPGKMGVGGGKGKKDAVAAVGGPPAAPPQLAPSLPPPQADMMAMQPQQAASLMGPPSQRAGGAGGGQILQGPLVLGPNGELPPGVHPGMLTGPQEWEWLTMSL